MPKSNEFVALLVALFVAAEIAVVWLLWQAANAVPKPFRMRWPWALWLLLVPIMGAALAVFLLVSLAKSYRGYFSQEKWPGRGERGYGLLVATVIFFWLSWMGRVYVGDSAFTTRWLYLLGPVPLVQISRVVDMAGGGAIVLAVGLSVLLLEPTIRRRSRGPGAWPGCGGAAAIATGILSWLSLMEYIPIPNPATVKRWPHLSVLVRQAHIASSWIGACAGLGWLVMVIIMLDWCRQIRRMQQRAKDRGAADAALAWLDGNFNQSTGDTPGNDPPPGK